MSNPSNRSHFSDSEPYDQTLREGLRGLPVPPISPDFDARVLAGLRRPMPWWLLAWHVLRPAMTAAACSLVITLIVVQWARASAPLPPRNQNTPGPRVDLLEAIDHPYIHAAYLTTLMPRPSQRPDANDPFDGSGDATPEPARVVRSGHKWTPPSS